MRVVEKAKAKLKLTTLDLLPKRFGAQLASILSEYYLSPARPERVIQIALRHAASPADFINDLCRVVPTEVIIDAIDQLVLERHRGLHAIFETAPQIANQSVKDAVEILKADDSGTVMNMEAVRHFIGSMNNYSGRLRHRFEASLLRSVVKAERLDLVMEILNASEYFSLGNLPLAYKTGILRCVLKNDPQSYPLMRANIGKGASDLDELKLLELDIEAGSFKAEPTHHDIMFTYLRTVPAGVRRDFDDCVRPFYDGQDMSLMNARTNLMSREIIVNEIRKCLKEKLPLSLVRASDGEGYAFASDDTAAASDDEIMRENHWWGCVLDQKLRRKLQSDIRKAIECADFVGVPSVYRFIRDTSSSMTGLKCLASIRGLLDVVSRIRPAPEAKLIEERIHHVIFQRRQIADIESNCSMRTHIISSVRPEILRQIFPAANAITVPTHHKTRTNNIFATDDTPLPYVYGVTIDRIKSEVCHGDLVLVGAGIIGKILVNEARSSGAVSLDIGAMIDYYAGAKTRPIADLI